MAWAVLTLPWRTRVNEWRGEMPNDEVAQRSDVRVRAWILWPATSPFRIICLAFAAAGSYILAKEGGRVDLAPLPSKPWQLPEVGFVLAIAAEALEVAGPRNRRYDRSAVGDARTVGKDGLCPVPSLCR
jgi:hypothetical protein